jgi:hypothetical protein
MILLGVSIDLDEPFSDEHGNFRPGRKLNEISRDPVHGGFPFVQTPGH